MEHEARREATIKKTMVQEVIFVFISHQVLIILFAIKRSVIRRLQMRNYVQSDFNSKYNSLNTQDATD
ncbi:hypothetical protein D7V95_08840 [bacterium J10(2018)]|nr:hypothetical protein D7V95_08840 [bacterium J10(2018)]